jgi:predicted component of type VI protein secretion system
MERYISDSIQDFESIRKDIDNILSDNEYFQTTDNEDYKDGAREMADYIVKMIDKRIERFKKIREVINNGNDN